MECKRAIIDLGTNTFHLLIAGRSEGQVKICLRMQIPVKLGEKGINQRKISPEAYQRGMDALMLFHLTMQEHEVEQVTAFGTSAIRDATNGRAFIDEAMKRFNIVIVPIPGDLEASLIYHGVFHSFPFPDKPVLVMDIGGGSVEFIIGSGKNLLWKKSYPIGAARLLETYHSCEPIAHNQISLLEQFLADELYELLDKATAYKVTTLIGAAGSFETLTDVLKKDLSRLSQSLSQHASIVNLSDFYQFHRLMVLSDNESRKALNGMLDFRVDMIVVASILMNFILGRLPVRELIVSEFSLKEGMLYGEPD
ncbi:MAG: exopolyphosphatase [Bacteroidia bacterium]|jgi:exopolyphosphatase/guanosine-5'-triphosphate,3'-diphosphate pyrophosphatase